MSKKNSIVLNHKNCLSNYKQAFKIYSEFKKKILKLKSKKFLVAVSGGPDSLALASMCKALHTDIKEKNFYYIHIDHGIRKNSSKEANIVKKILKKQKISLKILKNKFSILKNIQHNAREIRYSLITKECKKKKCNFVLTAHHQDDQIETFFIRLSRGSGVQGLSSMSSLTNIDKKIKLFRPFLNYNKKDLVSISKKIFGKYIKDPSNQDNKYLRSNIRKLLPLLSKYGIKKDQIIRSINNLKSSNKTIDHYFKLTFKKIVKKKTNKFQINKKDLFSLNDELQLKILGFLIKSLSKSYYPPRSKKVFTALRFLNLPKEIKYQLGGCILINKKNFIYVEKA